MCQKLVNRVAQSRQLLAVADPELLVLLEDWLDELENEVVSLAKEHGPLIPEDLAHKLGLSERGANFLDVQIGAGRQDTLTATRQAYAAKGTTLLALAAAALLWRSFGILTNR